VRQARSWLERKAWVEGLLVRRTGEDLAAWNARVAEQAPADEAALRAWLAAQGVDGYPAMLLVMERFGYPSYLERTPDELVEGQYRDRPALRPILETLLDVAEDLGEVDVQARKGYVTLVGPRRTFASIEPTTRTRVDLGLRFDGLKPTGRLEAARSLGQSQMTHRIALASTDDIDEDVVDWLRKAYEANA